MVGQFEFFPIPSPCKRICETDEKGYCLGCHRSRQERFDWLRLTDEQKRDVLRLCQQRSLRKRYLKWKAEQEKGPSSDSPQLDLL